MTRFRYACGHVTRFLTVPNGAMKTLHERYSRIPCRKCAKRNAKRMRSMSYNLLRRGLYGD